MSNVQTVDVAVPVTETTFQQVTTGRDFAQRIIRTLLQLVAGGGLTALFDQIVTDIPAEYAPYVVLLNTLIVTVAQNALESFFPNLTILKKPAVTR